MSAIVFSQMIRLSTSFSFIALLCLPPGLLIATESASLARIVVIGDSLSSAYGMTPEHGWVNLLAQRMAEQRPAWMVTNASITGDTTHGGLTRLPGIIDRHSPDILIIELGGNDGLRGFDLDTTRDNLKQMIVQARAQEARVLLLGVRLPPNYGPAYNELFEHTYQQLAIDENVPLVKYFLEGIDENLDLMQPDGIHPAPSAQPRMLENIWPALMPLLTTPQAAHRVPHNILPAPLSPHRTAA